MGETPPIPVRPGDRIAGRYKVERVLGAGGMGVVVAARHTALGHRVAVKLMRDEAGGDASTAARFLREARAAAHLKSEHAAKVTDFGQLDSGEPYLVLEYLDGEDLGSVVARGPLPVPVAVDYVLQACEAIAEAHALGIVHRDLKPGNLFLTRRLHGAPLVKVLDFGIAKLGAAGGAGALTTTRGLMGSPQYASPEQLRDPRSADARSDIWSLGVCLYELVSGAVPFDAPVLAVLCTKVLRDAPRPLPEVRPDVPDGLWNVVRRCLEKEPGARFASIVDLAAALEPFGPPSSRGAAERINAVLLNAQVGEGVATGPASVMPAPLGQTQGEATLGPRERGRSTAAFALAGGLAGVLIAVGLALALRHARASAAGEVAPMQASAATEDTPATGTPSPPGATEPPRDVVPPREDEPPVAAATASAPPTGSGEPAARRQPLGRPRPALDAGALNPSARY